MHLICDARRLPGRFVGLWLMLGGIGQPLSLLLKLNKKVSDLALYDIRGTPGVAADISHVDTHSIVDFL